MNTKKSRFSNTRYVVFPIRNHPEDLQHPLVQNIYPSELGYYPDAHTHYRERLVGIPDNILIYCQSGKGTIEINGIPYRLAEHTAFCIPANTPHRYFADDQDPWSILWLHFSLENIAAYPISQGVEIIATRERQSLIKRRFTELFSLCEKEYHLENAICAHSLLQLLIREIYFLKDFQTTNQHNILLERAIRYLNLHLADSITIQDLANHLEISGSYLSLIFNKYYHTGPINFLLDLRIEKACELLRISTLKIYEIALEVGYTDQYYFSRVFKKKTGLSPKAYKHSISG